MTCTLWLLFELQLLDLLVLLRLVLVYELALELLDLRFGIVMQPLAFLVIQLSVKIVFVFRHSPWKCLSILANAF